MNNQWDERYSDTSFVYGTEANSFLMENATSLQSPVLSLAEGEGRNAVFMASLGLDVLGVDGSAVGLKKAVELAQSRNVRIKTEVADLADFEPGECCYGSIVSISAHLPSQIRNRLYPLLIRSLLPGGTFVLESYSESQLCRTTGGPKDADLLMTVEKIQQELGELNILLLQEVVREVVEGKFHTGLASVIQFIGRKNL